MKRWVAAAAVALATSVAWDAAAYCRTTTCDPKKRSCETDLNDCVTEGIPLRWPSACIGFTVQVDGSPLRGISAKTARQVVFEGFETWMKADCGGSRPTLQVFDLGDSYCGTRDYNKSGGNANTWLFRDRDWPYEDSTYTIALTTVTFAVSSGLIRDADVELNSLQHDFTTSDSDVKADLLSVVTHEAGHALGLSHTPVPGATMYKFYDVGDLSFRDLDPDDVAGICALYPVDRLAEGCDPLPKNGLFTDCGPSTVEGRTCGVTPGSESPGTGLLVILLLVPLALGRRLRTR